MWTHANVQLDGTTVTMEITVEAEDRYNFNSGAVDYATSMSDDVNGRFAEVGLAKSFNVHGSLIRTITWELGDPPGDDNLN